MFTCKKMAEMEKSLNNRFKLTSKLKTIFFLPKLEVLWEKFNSVQLLGTYEVTPQTVFFNYDHVHIIRTYV